MMNRIISALLMLMLAFVPIAMAEVAATEGYDVKDNVLTVRLWTDVTKPDVEWIYEANDESILTCQSEAQPVGDSPIRAWKFAPRGDGETFVTFYYEDLEDAQAQPRMLCYVVTVTGGIISDVIQEDLSEDEEFDGDEGAVVLYQGETGGMDLMVPDDMTRTDTPEGVKLTSADGTMTMLINYQKNDDPAELFAQLENEDTAAAIYNDDATGSQVLDSYVDNEADPPYATLLMSTKDGFVEYNGYKVPDGGVLHIHTTYTMEDDGTGADFADEDDFDEADFGDVALIG